MTASASTKVTELLIDGQLVGAGGGRFATINPATEEPLGRAADADAADLVRAIAAARVAFDASDWSRDVWGPSFPRTPASTWCRSPARQRRDVR